MQLAKSFISYKDKVYFVSTINRQSSAALAYGEMYAETIAWEYDPETHTRGDIVKMDEACENSLRGHNRVIEFINNGDLI